jgi:hypothetical protein
MQFMEVDYNMLVQNHVHYSRLSKKNHFITGAVIKDLIPQCGGEEFKSPRLQPKLLWLLR